MRPSGVSRTCELPGLHAAASRPAPETIAANQARRETGRSELGRDAFPAIVRVKRTRRLRRQADKRVTHIGWGQADKRITDIAGRQADITHNQQRPDKRPQVCRFYLPLLEDEPETRSEVRKLGTGGR